MIVKTGAALRGSSTYGLVAYLMGPGRANEHLDARVIAGAGPVEWLQPPPPTDGRPGLDVRGLVRHLDQHLLDVPGGPPAKHVFHTIMANPAADRVLTDDEWAVAAYDMMRELGLAGTEQGLRDIRWVAIRHDDAHIHLAGTLVRADGSVAHTPNDFKAAAIVRARMEARYGLTQTNGGDRTASIRPKRAEMEKAARMGRYESERETVRRLVRAAASTARSAEEFRSELASSRLRFVPRHSIQDPTQITGYKVSLRARNADAPDPVWFAGGGLDRDLTWPKLTARWAPAVRPARDSAHEEAAAAVGRPSPEQLAGMAPQQREQVQRRISRAEIAERVGILVDADQQVTAAADVLREHPVLVDGFAAAAADAAAAAAGMWQHSPHGRVPLSGVVAAGDAAQRAGRTPGGGPPVFSPHAALLRTAVRSMSQAGQLTSTGDTAEWVALAVQVAAMLDAVADARAAQRRTDQAAAARAAAAGFRTHAALAGTDLTAARAPAAVHTAQAAAEAATAARETAAQDAEAAHRPDTQPAQQADPPRRPAHPTQQPPSPRRTR